MFEEYGVIETKAKFSDDKKYRYSLTRVWKKEGEEQKKRNHVAIVMLNPSKADLFTYDITVTNVQNYLVKKGFSGMTVVNLFAYMSTPQSGLKNKEEKYETYNTEAIYEACKEADTIIIAWVRDGYIIRRREVEHLLYEFRNKTLCFEDEQGRKMRHPLQAKETWTLEPYHFPLVKAKKTS